MQLEKMLTGHKVTRNTEIKVSRSSRIKLVSYSAWRSEFRKKERNPHQTSSRYTATKQLIAMSSLPKIYLLVAVTLFVILVSMPSSQAARASEIKQRWEQLRSQEGKQWDNFPYLMMMMSSNSGNTVLPSVWLVPVVVAGCIMLILRGNMEWPSQNTDR